MKLIRIVAGGLLLCPPLCAQKPYQQTFPFDVPPPPHFRANRTSYSAVMDILLPTRPSVKRKQLEPPKTLQFETIWGQLADYKSCYVRGFISPRPGQRLVVRA